MSNKPNLIISALDADRIEALLEAQPNHQFSGRQSLEAELNRADIVNPEKMPSNIVTMNSTVSFKELSSGDEYAFTLAYPQDIQPTDDNKVSILAPVGSALLGLAIGDTIEWAKPGGGMMQLHIQDISYQPERTGELHR